MEEKVAVVDTPVSIKAVDEAVNCGAFIPIKPIADKRSSPKAIIGKLITCYKCGQPGGTLVKDDKGYRHKEGFRCVPAVEVKR